MRALGAIVLFGVLVLPLSACLQGGQIQPLYSVMGVSELDETTAPFHRNERLAREAQSDARRLGSPPPG